MLVFKCTQCHRIWTALEENCCLDTECRHACEVINLPALMMQSSVDPIVEAQEKPVQAPLGHADAQSQPEVFTDEAQKAYEGFLQENEQQTALTRCGFEGAYLISAIGRSKDQNTDADKTTPEFVTKTCSPRLGDPKQTQPTKPGSFFKGRRDRARKIQTQSYHDELQETTQAQENHNRLQSPLLGSTFDLNSSDLLPLSAIITNQSSSTSDTETTSTAKRDGADPATTITTGGELETELLSSKQSRVPVDGIPSVKKSKNKSKKKKKRPNSSTSITAPSPKFNVELPLPEFLLPIRDTPAAKSDQPTNSTPHNNYATAAVQEPGNMPEADADGWTRVKGKDTKSGGWQTQQRAVRVQNASSYLFHKEGGAFGRDANDERQDANIGVSYEFRSAKHVVRTSVPRI